MTDSLIYDLDNFSVSESATCEVEECKQYLSSFSDPLTIVTQNIRSIFKNFDNYCSFQQRLNINCDIIVLTECWLSIHSHLPLLPDYSIHKSNFNYNQNDGIVVYTKNFLNVTVEEPDILDCNRLLFKIGYDFAIIALYRPPSFRNSNIFIESLNTTLQQLSNFRNIIIIGDININIISDSGDSAAQEYLNVCSYHGLLPAHMLPTHESGSCLDHIMLKTNFPSKTLVTNSTITDHNAALLTLNCKLPNRMCTKAINKINFNGLEEDLCNVDFDTLCHSDDADTCMSNLIKCVQQSIIKNTMSIRLNGKNYNIKPWITPGLIRCMRHRDKLHKKAKLNPDNMILQLSYKRYRNFCNNLLKKVKISYDKNQLQKAGKNSKKIWQFVKNVTHTTKQHESSSRLLQLHSSQLTSANSVNDYFVNVGLNLAQKFRHQSSTAYETPPSNQSSNCKSFVMLDTDEAEVQRIIMNLKDDSAVGWDNISNIILKRFKHIFVPVLTNIFNKCLAKGCFPKCLKKAVVVAIHKTGSKEKLENYRPISILPAISKILEKIINNQLVKYLDNKSILSKTQFGFRSKLSTADAVHELTDYVVRELDKSNRTVGIFLDFAKAFDTVSIPILLQKLELLGIRGTQLKLFKNYLDERTQCVKIGSMLSSDLKNTSFGVPQGSILGPTLFLIYINDLCNLNLDRGKIISYADDTVLLFSASTEAEVFKLAQQGFNVVSSWLQQHILTLNADKTNYVQFSMRKLKTARPSLVAHRCEGAGTEHCNCPDITMTNKIKYLGVIIDETLSFRQHIEALSGRVRKLIYVFKKLRTVLDSTTIRSVYFSLCQSILTYCITSWGGTYKSDLLTIERAQRAILKVSTYRSFLYPTDLLYQSCNVLTVRQLFIMSTVLKQHAALPYSNEIAKKRRKDLVCPSNIDKKHAFSSRFHVFLGPLLYNRLNGKLDLYPLNYNKTKTTLRGALQKMTYEDTENILTIIK